jgi:dynein heavy chain
MLVSMEAEWQTQLFDVIAFRESGIPILGGQRVEEMQMLLDEHVLVSATIVNNPDVAPIIADATRWSETMNFTRDILELFISVQTSYLYLWPIFNTITL